VLSVLANSSMLLAVPNIQNPCRKVNNDVSTGNIFAYSDTLHTAGAKVSDRGMLG
jgi:hypothetical protein